MLPNISKNLKWIKKNPTLLKNIYKGIEREGIRINKKGSISKKNYPKKIGYALTHNWITTDFSENILEIITPKTKKNNKLLYLLKDIHKYTIKKIKNELIWPFSIPCKISNNNIKLAKYGNSNIGILKKLYRKGLKKRYGILMNMISGIHYNFSLPKKLLKIWKNKYKQIKDNSDGYLKLIRNYLKFGWIIPYIFGSSPTIPYQYIKNEKINFSNIKKKNDIIFLPWATSLRLGHILTHKNKITNKINIKFNTLKEYIKTIKQGLYTKSKKFEKIGLRNKKNKLQQMNINFLQMESELYTQIRPKRNTKKNKSILHNIKKKGIEYVEIRSLDLNPFSSIGINKTQILILDIFLIWCFLANSPKINNEELPNIYKNWKKISLKGRKPNLKLNNFYKKKKIYLSKILKKLYKDLFKIAKIFDICYKNNNYTNACKFLKSCIKNPNNTYSANIIKTILNNKSMKKTGIKIAKQHKNKIQNTKYKILNENDFKNETQKSIKKYIKIKKNKKINKIKFEDYLYKKMNSEI